jgi:hypothetical protein
MSGSRRQLRGHPPSHSNLPSHRRRLVAATALAIVLLGMTLLARASAHADPLTPDSPLYSPSAPLVDENPNVTASYQGTLTEDYSAAGVGRPSRSPHVACDAQLG